jgi:hypothetical protein
MKFFYFSKLKLKLIILIIKLNKKKIHNNIPNIHCILEYEILTCFLRNFNMFNMFKKNEVLRFNPVYPVKRKKKYFLHVIKELTPY